MNASLRHLALALAAGLLLSASASRSAAGGEATLIAQALGLAPDQTVADVGAGAGEWTKVLAEVVGPAGRVWATEVDAHDLEGLRALVEEEALANVEVAEGTQTRTGLPDACCDAILLRRVYHHFTDGAAMRAEILRALKPGGRLLVVDLDPEQGGREAHGVVQAEMVAEMVADGFEVVRRLPDWPSDWPSPEAGFGVVFRRPVGACERRWTFPVPFFQSIRWSPDGRRLVVSAVTESWDDGYSLFVGELSDGGVEWRRLTTGVEPALVAVVSPDGSRLAFQGRGGGDPEVYVAALDGDAVSNLTGDPARDGYPSWAPDGDRIAFHSDRAGSYDLWVMRADGSDPRRLTDDPADDYNPAYSPDGAWIAFDSDRDELDGDEILLVAADGSQTRALGVAGAFPTWSPDGSTILVGDANGGLSAVAVDGPRVERLLPDAVMGAFSPDGSTIAAAAITFDSACRDFHSLVLLVPDGRVLRTLAPPG